MDHEAYISKPMPLNITLYKKIIMAFFANSICLLPTSTCDQPTKIKAQIATSYDDKT